MNINLKFEEKDFATLRTFEKAVKAQLGPNVYVGTNSMCFYFDYPSALVAMLRPYPANVQLEFVLESATVNSKN